MPRRPRIIVPGVPLHLIQRGNNRQACFFADEDYGFYLDWLQDYSSSTGCTVHAYVLMTNHVHLLLTPKHKESAGNLMKRLGQRYVQYINRIYKRSGTLWEGRFRSSVIHQDTYLLTCVSFRQACLSRWYCMCYDVAGLFCPCFNSTGWYTAILFVIPRHPAVRMSEKVSAVSL